MTYLNIYQAAISDVGVFVQNLRITAPKGLEWASEAIHQYQTQTGVARDICFLRLNPNSLDGSYDLSSDVDFIEKLEYYGDGVPTDNPSGGIPVNLVDYDYFFQNQQGYMLPANQGYAMAQPTVPIASSSNPLLPSQYYATTYGKCKLLLYPFAGIGGQIKIYYKPFLLPYTPDAVGRWSTFGPEPDATMATEHIPSEFNGAYEGIKSYVAAQIVSSIPNHMKIFPYKYTELMNRFAAGVENVLKTNPPTGVNNKSQPRIIRRIM